MAGGLNLYGFDGSPTQVVDPLGLDTAQGQGDDHATHAAPESYATAEEAAVAAMQQNNASSVSQNLEMGSWIQQNDDGTYSARPATVGQPKGISNMAAPEANDVAWWHTHGADDPGYITEEFSGDEGDQGYSKATGKPGHLATPTGTIKRYDPSTDTVTTLPETAPPE